MAKQTIDVATFRRDMKGLGYGVTIRRGSTFDMATVRRDGMAINGGNVVDAEHLEAHRSFYDYKNANSVVDGDVRVIF